MNRLKKATVVTGAAGAMILAGAGAANASAEAEAAAIGSPGVISGNVVQVPIHIPINLCNNTINVGGVLNPTFGNTCINADSKRHGYYHQEYSHKEYSHREYRHHEGGEHREKKNDDEKKNENNNNDNKMESGK